MVYLLILVLALLILGSAFFSASETALFSLSATELQLLKKKKDPDAIRVVKMLSSPRDLLITLIIVNVIINIFIQNVASNIFGDFSGWLLNVGVPLSLCLVFGEFIPKSVGIANNLRLSPALGKVLWPLMIVLLPLRKILISITGVVSQVMFFFLRKEEDISIGELQHVLKTSQARGVVEEDEAELMQGYLCLQGSSAKKILRPREEVLHFDIEEDLLSRLVHLFVDQECTRIPVCKKGMDQVLGVMSAASFFLHKEEIKQPQDLIPFLKKPFFVPETTPGHLLLDQMYQRQESLAIVVDEYGAVSGLIALEDLVEIVVGKIADRRDEKSRYTRSGEDVIIASGKLELAEVNNLLGVTLESKHQMVTLGGWLTEQIGDIPQNGQKWKWKNLLFQILSGDQKRVRRVYIRRMKD